jgi:hypothetical protein
VSATTMSPLVDGRTAKDRPPAVPAHGLHRQSSSPAETASRHSAGRRQVKR